MDTLIEQHYSRGDESYSIYILNLNTSIRSSYRYSQNNPLEEIDSQDGCSTSLWTGLKRYMWLDISTSKCPTSFNIIPTYGLIRHIRYWKLWTSNDGRRSCHKFQRTEHQFIQPKGSKGQSSSSDDRSCI